MALWLLAHWDYIEFTNSSRAKQITLKENAIKLNELRTHITCGDEKNRNKLLPHAKGNKDYGHFLYFKVTAVKEILSFRFSDSCEFCT